MSNDADSRTFRKTSTVTAQAGREAERAEALRANLMRRKAQARGRTETGNIGDGQPAKEPGDA